MRKGIGDSGDVLFQRGAEGDALLWGKHGARGRHFAWQCGRQGAVEENGDDVVGLFVRER